MEKERDFYFSKLRDIEILCQRHELEHLPVEKHLLSLLFGILLVLIKTSQIYLCLSFRSVQFQFSIDDLVFVSVNGGYFFHHWWKPTLSLLAVQFTEYHSTNFPLLHLRRLKIFISFNLNVIVLLTTYKFFNLIC